MTSAVQTVIDGITAGSLYALFALGVALVFGIMRLINFAHGELIMIGAYAAIVGSKPTVLVFVCATLAACAAAILMERLAFRPVRNADLTTMLVTSFAVSFACQNLAVAVFGSLQRGGSVAPELSKAITLGSLHVPRLSPVIVATTIVLSALLSAFLTKTTMGIQMRAAAEDFGTARMLGVRANRVMGVAFAVSGMFAGVGAFFYVAQLGYVTPTIGTAPVLAAFVATVIGGVGSLRGAVVGGYLFGMVSVVLQAALPSEARGFSLAICYSIVLGFLLVRPNGLLPAQHGLMERA